MTNPFLARALELDPDGLAAGDGRDQLTYRELADESERAARELKRAGVEAGSVVALHSRPGIPGLVFLHGVWSAGASVAPLNAGWTPRELKEALEILRPHFLLDATSGARSLKARSLEGVGGVESPSGGEDRTARDLPGPVAHLLTSGTTGRPRRVTLSVDNLMASAEASRERLGLRPDDRWLASLSTAHVGGLALVSRAAFLGSGLVMTSAFQTEAFLELARDGRISHASLVPTMLRRVLRTVGKGSAPGSLRCLLIGGAAAPRGLVADALAAGFPLALTYGLTEASSQVATAPPSLVREKPGTVGMPLPGMEVRVGEGGEILVRGRMVATGCAGDDGWLETGDLGRLDRDGHLWVTGRLSERIVSGGVNVDPREVEEVLLRHDEVASAVVLGLPDPEWGERVAAAVVPVGSGRSPEDELRRHLRGSLSPAKRPKEIRFVETLPVNANGKIDRREVRRLFAGTVPPEEDLP